MEQFSISHNSARNHHNCGTHVTVQLQEDVRHSLKVEKDDEDEKDGKEDKDEDEKKDEEKDKIYPLISTLNHPNDALSSSFSSSTSSSSFLSSSSFSSFSFSSSSSSSLNANLHPTHKPNE